MTVFLSIIMPLKEANDYITQCIESNRPFLISRLGLGYETYLSYQYDRDYTVDTKMARPLHNHAGIYCNHYAELVEFARKYSECLQNSTALAAWGEKSGIDLQQTYFVRKYNLYTLPSRILEPFYCVEENLIPWSHALQGKKVLVVHPFVDTMQTQLQNGFQIFKDKPLFLEGQEFVFYKSFITNAMNKTHDNWIETFEVMCNDISKLDFDVALLGCGGYGLPLCNYIHKNLNKSAIYVGGGLQLMFGIMGKRWENHPFWKKVMAENNCAFVRPSANEQVQNQHQIEGGCYW